MGAKSKEAGAGQAKGLTAPDMELRRFMDLQKQIKELTKELDGLKANIRHRGSFSTSHYIATVETVTVVSAPGKGKLIELYGPGVQEHFVEGTRTTVKVTKKGGSE